MKSLTGIGGRTAMDGGGSAGRTFIYVAIIIVAACPPAYMVFWLLMDPTPASNSALAEEKPAAISEPDEEEWQPPPLTPASPALISGALEAIWAGEEAEGISIGEQRMNMRELLRASFPRPPTTIEVLYSPAPNTAGFFTIKASDGMGNERLVAVRLLPRPGEDKPWKVDQLLLVGAPQLNQKKK